MMRPCMGVAKRAMASGDPAAAGGGFRLVTSTHASSIQGAPEAHALRRALALSAARALAACSRLSCQLRSRSMHCPIGYACQQLGPTYQAGCCVRACT